MSVADHWRAVDPVDWIPVLSGREVLRLADERELAWAYITTTPLALHGGTAANWLEVARQQHWQNDFDFAERAFAVAASLEPANAEIARERTLNRAPPAGTAEGTRLSDPFLAICNEINGALTGCSRRLTLTAMRRLPSEWIFC